MLLQQMLLFLQQLGKLRENRGVLLVSGARCRYISIISGYVLKVLNSNMEKEFNLSSHSSDKYIRIHSDSSMDLFVKLWVNIQNLSGKKSCFTWRNAFVVEKIGYV